MDHSKLTTPNFAAGSIKTLFLSGIQDARTDASSDVDPRKEYGMGHSCQITLISLASCRSYRTPASIAVCSSRMV